MAKRRYHGRTRRYYNYRAHHFTVEEAKELKTLPRLDLFELRIMVKQRDNMWKAFDEKATDRGWGKSKRDTEWKAEVAKFYVDHDFITKVEAQRVVKIGAWRFTDTIGWKDIWFWFDYVRSTLPIEKQYGRSHRAARYVTKKERLDKAKKEADRTTEEQRRGLALEGLFRTVVNNPANDKNLTKHAQSFWGFKGKSLLRTAITRGYKR